MVPSASERVRSEYFEVIMYREIGISTTSEDGLYEITDDVRKTVEESGVREGLCIVYSPHTTAAVTVTSRMDLNGFEDLKDEIRRLVPTRVDFKHQADTPSDAAGHIKSALIGVEKIFIVHDGNLILGSSQGIFFMEFDGPRKRKVSVMVTRHDSTC